MKRTRREPRTGVQLDRSEHPDVLLALMVSFLPVHDHALAVPRLSRRMNRITQLPASWPPRLDLQFPHGSHRGEHLTDAVFTRVFGGLRPQHLALAVCWQPDIYPGRPSLSLDALPMVTKMTSLTSLDIQLRSRVDTTYFCPGFGPNGPNVTHLTYRGTSTMLCENFDMKSAFPKLQRLTLGEVNEYIAGDLVTILQQLPKSLPELECTVETTNQLRAALLCPGLTVLRIARCDLRSFTETANLIEANAKTSKLTEIHLITPAYAQRPLLLSLRGLRNLRTLALDHLDGGEPNVLGDIDYRLLSKFKNLTRVQLGPNVNSTIIPELATLNLQHLTVRTGDSDMQAYNMLNALVARGSPMLEQLQVLELVDDNRTDDKVLMQLLPHLPRLREFKTDSRNLTMEVLPYLARCNKELEKLSVSRGVKNTWGRAVDGMFPRVQFDVRPGFKVAVRNLDAEVTSNDLVVGQMAAWGLF